jgi:hypothetical protein
VRQVAYDAVCFAWEERFRQNDSFSVEDELIAARKFMKKVYPFMLQKTMDAHIQAMSAKLFGVGYSQNSKVT